MSVPRPPPCSVCGSPMLEAVTPDEVVTFEGERLRFTRHTDFVACPKCMTLYRIEDLRLGKAIPVTDRALAGGEEPNAEED